MPVVFQNIVLIILYFAAGQGAWLLAIPPFYASVFWPSAGFALAFCYLYGYRVLPGVFIGAALLAVYAPMVEVIDSGVYMGAAGIGFGSALQAFAGCFLLKKFLGHRTRLHDLRSIALLAGFSVFSCLISASVAFLVFYLRGSLSFDGFLSFWQPWFIGDVLGVLVVTPLLILLLGFGDFSVSLKRKLAVFSPIIILFAMILVLFVNIKDRSIAAHQNNFQQDAKLVQRELASNFEFYHEEMEALYSFFMSSQHVDREEFATFVRHALEEHPGINVLAWAPYVMDEEREAFLQVAQLIYGADYSIQEFSSEGYLGEASSRPSYMPLYYAFPENVTRGVMGFDLLSHPVRRKAIENAMRTKQASATESIRLVNQGEGSDLGFILVQPVHQAGALEGMLVGAFQYKKVVRQVMSAWEGQGIELVLKAMHDGEMSVVYETISDASDAQWPDGFMVEVPYEYAQQKWLFRYYVPSDFYYANLNYTIWYILIAALFCLYFAIVFLLIITGYAAMMERAIQEKTKEISKQNTFLNLIMDSVPDMIFVKDEDFNVIQANQSFFEKFDPKLRDSLIGTKGLEQFPKDEQEIYLIHDKKAFSEGFSEVEEHNTDYRGVTRTMMTRKQRFYDDDDQPFLLGYSRDVTDFLNAQRKLESILDSTAEGLITFRENGIIETFNKTCELVFGYKAEEAIGQNVAMLMAGDDARDHGAALSRYLNTGEGDVVGKRREVQAKHKDGTVFFIEMHVAEVKLGARRIFSGALRDISERKKAAELSQQIAQIFNSATIEFYIFDAKSFEFLFVNEGAVQNMGYSEEELIGHRPSEFVPAYKDEKFYAMAEALLSGEQDRIEFDMQHTRKDGSKYDVLANIQLTQFDGRPAFIASMLDMTERNEVLDELKRSNKELESFAYVTSHDLKAPLRHISMSAGFIKEKFGDQFDEQSKELLSVMINATERMQNMIESLLAYSRVGRDDVDMLRVNLNEAMLAAKQNLSSEFLSSGASLEYQTLPTIYASRSLIIQLFQNLIQNSIKYSKEAVPPHIKVSVKKHNDAVEIAFADNGIGVEPAYADKIFQIFQRLHRDNEYEGVGIGLSICKRIVEFHGGEISLDKKYTGGAKIVLLLPKEKH